MSDDIQNLEEIFHSLSEETFNAVLKFMQLSPEAREQVMHYADELIS